MSDWGRLLDFDIMSHLDDLEYLNNLNVVLFAKITTILRIRDNEAMKKELRDDPRWLKKEAAHEGERR